VPLPDGRVGHYSPVTSPIRVKIDAEEGAFPVWTLDGQPDDIGERISDALRVRLQEWCDQVCGIDGHMTRPPDPRLTKAEAANQTRRRLARDLQAELGRDYQVLYVDAETRQVDPIDTQP
jgi:hypothetical protein